MQTQKATLDERFGYKVEGIELDKDSLFFVDWQNLKGVEDLVLIFACMGLSFSGHHPHFETIKHLLDLSNPVKPPQGVPQQPKAEDLKLPKMKQVK
jgi:hypothetical protein